MAWFYFVDGTVRFPAPDGPSRWRSAPVPAWRGKGKVTVDQVLGWSSKDTLMDESAPPEFRSTYFLDVRDDGPSVHVAAVLHRDDADMLVAVLDVAASLGAKGKVLFNHAFDPDSGIRVELAGGSAVETECDVEMPAAITDALTEESEARARRIDAGTRSAAPSAPDTKSGAQKKSAAAKKKPAAQALASAKKKTAAKKAAKKKPAALAPAKKKADASARGRRAPS